MVQKRIVVFNLKTYSESTGENARRIAKFAEEAFGKFRKENLRVVVAPTAFDLSGVRAAVGPTVEVFAQHVDPITPGKNTGWLSPENAKAAGATGTIINHAEHQIPIERIGETIAKCKELGLATVVCVKNKEEAVQVCKFSPDYISIEFPELIGSLKSVSVLKPAFISEAAEAVRKTADIPVLCGAGVAGTADVRAALELGTIGVILAAYINLSKDQKAAVEMIIEGF